MNNGNPLKLKKLFTHRPCNIGSRGIMQIVNSILLSLEFFDDPVRLLRVDISSDGATI